MNRTIREEYNDWIVGLACEWCNPYGSYEKLLEYLQDELFRSAVARDENRMKDGENYRRFFYQEIGEDTDRALDDIPGPATFLEVMVALAAKQEQIMWDWDIGDRTGVWFYDMLKSSHLSDYDDYHFDEEEVEIILYNIKSRNYKKNGEGGLFIVDEGCDIRSQELWLQMTWHINYLSGK